MEIWIALLRGINVGGRNRLPMAKFRSLLTDLGCRDVSTYVQSGNAVFTHTGFNRSELGTGISDAIAQECDFAPDVLLLDRKALQAAITANPFREAEAEPKSLHLFFFASPVGSSDITNSGVMDRLNNLRIPSESIHLDDSVFYLHAPDGIGKSKLARDAEKALGTPTTARNWRTITNLAEMAKSKTVIGNR